MTSLPEYPILFANEENTVIILDIPLSITCAQILPGQLPSNLQLVSCAPLTKPFSSTEPKSKKALLNTRNHDGDNGVHKEYAGLISKALVEVSNDSGEGRGFCLPRYVAKGEVGQPSSRGKKRKHEVTDSHSPSENVPRKASAISPDIAGPIVLSNDTERPLYTSLEPDDESAIPTHILPPQSTVLLGRCSADTAPLFRSTARQFTPQGRFELIVLDPPWPNRSVRRSSSYDTSPTLPSLVQMLLSLDLDIHIAPEGYVAIWITNKPAVREAVLIEGGLFDTWGLELVEEWIWCKVTKLGEPVTAIEGVWRKCYEVCLIGKRQQGRGEVEVKRRVVFAVPDLHSRKPCLKGLVKKILLGGKELLEHKALEVFARYAVAGWMSWGDEVVKFNERQHWIDVNSEK